MNDQIIFVAKVLIISLFLSILIKYGGQSIEISPTALNATLAITIPPVLMALTLLWRLIIKQKVES
ncbi:MAG TPA: hypothetical protein DCF68_14990 [Cyanothece sp. UBA12306]|nr:hypothetical protein [Cyanothece sp. UBA12306]